MQQSSLFKEIRNPDGDENIDTNFKKLFKIKSYADIVESLTAAVYEKAGLHGVQTFLKFAGVLKKKDESYALTYKNLIDDVDRFDAPDGDFELSKLKPSTVMTMGKALNYKFKSKNVSN